MRVPRKPFDYVVVTGSSYEMGRQYGEDCKEDIAYMLNWWMGLTLSAREELTRETALAEGARLFKDGDRVYPETYKFLRGMAEGSGLSFEEILFIQCSNEINNGLTDLNHLETPGCTSVAISNYRAQEGKTIVAQNLDWHTELKSVVLHLRPEAGPEVLTVTFTGCLAQIGISSAGFGMCVNSIVIPDEAKVGAPMYVLTQEAMLAPSFVDAMNTLTLGRRAMSFNYLFAHRDGILLDLETSTTDFNALQPEDGILLHTNHYLTPYFQPLDAAKVFTDSYCRYQRAKKLIADCGNKVSVDDVKALLSDQEPDPYHCICLRAVEGDPYTVAYVTNFSIICFPEDGTILVSETPSEGQWTEYRLGD